MKVTLSINPNYVRDWGFAEAIRELYQNALDQQTKITGNTLGFEYIAAEKHMVISNKASTLDRSSLMLGSSTKADDDETIGQFGEGYKLALLVLLRLGHKVVIENYAAREKWVPEISHSKEFGCEALKITIIKHVFKSVPNHDLTFHIFNVSVDDYIRCEMTNIHLRVKYPAFIQCEQGRILTDPGEQGRLYVRGLYIETIKDKKMLCGYDIIPKHLQIDRDRKTVKTFDLYWLTSRMWTDAYAQNKDLVQKMVEDGNTDVQYIQYSNDRPVERIAEDTYTRIKEAHPNLEPVTNQADAAICKAHGIGTYFVTGTQAAIIAKSPRYMAPVRTQTVRKTPADLIDDYFNNLISETELRTLSQEWGWT